MKNGPSLFSTFGNKSKEPLSKDYPLDHKFSISTPRVAGVAVRSTATNKDGLSTVDIGAVYKSKNTSIVAKIDTQSNLVFLVKSGHVPPFLLDRYALISHYIAKLPSFDSFKALHERKSSLDLFKINLTIALKKIVPLTNIDASFNLHDFESGKIATTFTFKEIVPLTNAIASFHMPNFRSSKLKLQYFNQHATLTSKMSLNEAPTVSVSTTTGTPTLAIGAKAVYDISSNKFINFAAGINFNNKPYSTASLILGDNGDTIRALYRYRFDVLKKTVVAAEITRRLSANETDFVVGGCYVFDCQTSVKVKLDSCGKIGAVLQHKIIPKSFVSLSSELDLKVLHKTPKFGFSLVLKP